MRLAREYGCGTKGLRIRVLGLIVTGSKNSEAFLRGNRCRADTMSTMSKLKGPMDWMLEHPETIAYWRRKPFYKEPLTKPVGRKGIGNAEASQDIHSYCPIYFLNNREQGVWSKFWHLKCPMVTSFYTFVLVIKIIEPILNISFW